MLQSDPLLRSGAIRPASSAASRQRGTRSASTKSRASIPRRWKQKQCFPWCTRATGWWHSGGTAWRAIGLHACRPANGDRRTLKLGSGSDRRCRAGHARRATFVSINRHVAHEGVAAGPQQADWLDATESDSSVATSSAIKTPKKDVASRAVAVASTSRVHAALSTPGWETTRTSRVPAQQHGQH